MRSHLLFDLWLELCIVAKLDCMSVDGWKGRESPRKLSFIVSI